MVILYNEELEMYFQIYACIMDPKHYYANFDCTTMLFVKKKPEVFDAQRQAYKISNSEWQTLKKNLNDWVTYELDKQLLASEEHFVDDNDDESLFDDDFDIKEKRHYFIRSADETRYFEIMKAIPYYKIYNKWGEEEDEDWNNTLRDVKYKQKHDSFPLTIVPRPAEDCGFQYVICRWECDEY